MVLKTLADPCMDQHTYFKSRTNHLREAAMEGDTIPAKLAGIYHRQTEGRKVKWEHLPPGDRSLWRLIARVGMKEAMSSEHEQ